jgi:hypothetical protein
MTRFTHKCRRAVFQPGAVDLASLVSAPYRHSDRGRHPTDPTPRSDKLAMKHRARAARADSVEAARAED